MRMRGTPLAAAALLLAPLLAGCSLPGGGDQPDPVATAVGMALVDVDLDGTVAELGDRFTGEATVVNQGDVAALDTLQVRLGDQVVHSVPVELAAKEFRHVDLAFGLPGYGVHEVTFAFGTTTHKATLRVKAPRLEDVRFEHENLPCEPSLPFTISVRNTGDGVARQVVVHAEVVNMSDIVQSNGTQTVGTVAADARRDFDFELFAPDVCEQEDYFRVRATITAHLLDPVPFRSEPFVL